MRRFFEPVNNEALMLPPALSNVRVLVVGSTGGSHIGGSLFRAGAELGIEMAFLDVDEAWHLGTTLQRLFWHGLGRRPIHLKRFSESVLRHCRDFSPDLIVATGHAPITGETLAKCRAAGSYCVNYSTDDPFNRQMHMPWFMRALPEYDMIFTPRRVNIAELRTCCRRVEYLPFGYDPQLFFRDPEQPIDETWDLFFAGNAEPSRMAYIESAVAAGINVSLYGNYWGQSKVTRSISRGHADIPTLRKGIADSRLALCLVRHQNRDGHSMRTFELAACGACMVVEDTIEHRQIFGEDGENVAYFRTPAQMVEKARELLNNEPTRRRLRMNAHAHITHGKNTYVDRLQTMAQRALLPNVKEGPDNG